MRKILMIFLSVALMLTMIAVFPVVASAAKMGDPNNDGFTNAQDALVVLKSVVGTITLDDQQRVVADVDANSIIGALDALLILQFTVGKINKFPAESETEPMPWSPDLKAVLQTTQPTEIKGARTISQAAHMYDPDLDLPSDSVMMYVHTIASAKGMYNSWKDSGRDLSIMIMAGRDGDNEYFNMYPERGKEDVHTYSNGDLMLHSGISYYMLPTRHYVKYKMELVEKACSYNPTYLAIEEPEVFVYATYSQGFKEEWEDYYKEPWQDPLSSAEARYKASKLITHLWIDFYQQVRDYIDANCPNVKLLVAAHDVLNYDHHQIVSILSSLTSLNIVDGVIGQTWSDCIYGAGSAYGGDYPRRLFERAWIEYASYSDTMEEGQELFTLSDAKADNSGWGWDVYEKVWKLSVATQLLIPELNQFQSYIWPHRAFSADTPDAYRTKQLNVFSAMREVGGTQVDLYAGTPGISLAMSDTLTWQYGSQYMPITNTQDGIHSLSLPIIEWGIPLEVTNLDKVTSAKELEGINVLILTYDIMKPLSEEANGAVAEWVKQGGTLLYVGGHDAAESIPDEWWSKKGQTPLENLLSHLNLNVQVNTLDNTSARLKWIGGQCKSFNNASLTYGMSRYTATFSGNGITPVLYDNASHCLGFQTNVGEGNVVMLGLPSSYFASTETGPQNLRELARYTVETFTDTTWDETNMMLSKRGPYIAAQALNYTDGEQINGDFIDLFDENLSLLTKKTLTANESALLYDVSSLRTVGTPRLGFTGGELVGEVIETANTTSFSIKGPTNSTSATRLLGNGKYPKSIRITCDGQRYQEYTEQWDNETGSLLLLVKNSISPALDIEIEWSNEPIDNTVPYEWEITTYVTTSSDADASFIARNSGTATRSLRRVIDGELVYQFDLTDWDSPYFEFVVGANYLLEASLDDQVYHPIARWDGEPMESYNNRITAAVYPENLGVGNILYVRLKSSEETPSYGGAVFELKIYQKKPIR